MEELKPKNVVNNCTAEASDSAESRPLRQSHAGGKTAIRALRIRYNKLRKFQNRRIENSPQNKGQGQRHLVE